MESSNFSSDESTDEDEVIRNFDQEAQLLIEKDALPKKSQDRYNLAYDAFVKWKEVNNASTIDENVLICYFTDLKKKVCPATLWSVWSILKKMLGIKHNISITEFWNLKCLLKNNSKDYKPKKSLIFNWDQINEFINSADDYIYLAAKVILIFGTCGALRCAEFVNIRCCDVEDMKTKFLVNVKDTKNYVDRSFIIGPLFYSKVQQYISLKPNEQMDRFFIQYVNGKCIRQYIGKNKIGSTPSAIASYLKLDNPSQYTGHCFRRTSATLLSNSGANMTMVKQLGGWKSDAVASGYIADSMRSKTLIYQGITHEKKSTPVIPEAQPSTSRGYSSKVISLNDKEELEGLQLTFEDFSDEIFVPDKVIKNSDIPCDSKIDFQTAKGKAIPLSNINNNLPSKKFTSKPPVQLSFLKRTLENPVNEQLPKKVRNKDNANTENLIPIENMEHLSSKNSLVRFENCTINGNIINNYYYSYCKENENAAQNHSE